MLALLMALNALAIDAMIPALPQIGSSLHVAEENRRQLVVIAYFLGFGSTQLVWGPLSDRYGVKTIPTVVAFKGGEEVRRAVNPQSRGALEALIEG